MLDHNFGAGEPYTLGVEEEYMLLDGETLDLVQHVEAVLAATEGHELEPRINPELMQSVLEIATPVCSTPAEVDHELRKLRALRDEPGRAGRHARRLGRDAPVLACSSASASPRATATGTSSTSSSTSRAAS